MTTFYAVFRKPGRLWDRKKSAREQVFWDEHASFMDRLFDEGVIILAGPFPDGTGSLIIVAAESASQAHEMFREDPWTLRDVLEIADVKEWTIFLDGRSRV